MFKPAIHVIDDHRNGHWVVKNQMLEFVLGDGSGTFSLDKLKLHETFFFLSKILKLIYKIYWKNT